MPQARTAARLGIVKPLLLPETERAEEAQARGEKLKKIPLDSRAVSDVFMLAMGAYTPLDGFMGHDDWRGSCLDMKLTQRRVLADPDHASRRQGRLPTSIHAEEEVALIDAETGEILAVMQVREKYSIDKQIEAEHVYRTTDPKHPGVAKVLDAGRCQSGRPGHGAERRRISRQIRRPLYPPCRVAGDVPRKGLVECRGVPDPKSHAPQPRASGEDRGGGHRTVFSSIRCWGS